MSFDIFDKDEFLGILNTKFIGKNIIHNEITDSTNNLAKRENQNPDGTVFLADFQTNGRGRQGKTWISKKNEGLWFSVLLKPYVDIHKLSTLTLVTGLAVYRALKKIKCENVYIKWPNDIVFNKKKICGILSECSFKEDCIDYIILGVGINLYTEEFDSEIKNIATSLYYETGKKIKRCEFLAEILNEFEGLYLEWIENSIENIITDYKKACITLNKDVRIVINNSSYNAYVKDINNNGELIITKDGKEEVISAGEVSVRGVFDYV